MTKWEFLEDTVYITHAIHVQLPTLCCSRVHHPVGPYRRVCDVNAALIAHRPTRTFNMTFTCTFTFNICVKKLTSLKLCVRRCDDISPLKQQKNHLGNLR